MKKRFLIPFLALPLIASTGLHAQQQTDSDQKPKSSEYQQSEKKKETKKAQEKKQQKQAKKKADAHKKMDQRAKQKDKKKDAVDASAVVLLSSEALYDEDVMGKDGEVVGTIEEVIIDSQTRLVRFVILRVVAEADLEDSLVAIPFAKIDMTSEGLTLPYDRELLSTAPTYEAEKWQRMPTEKWDRLIAVYLDEEDPKMIARKKEAEDKRKKDSQKADKMKKADDDKSKADAEKDRQQKADKKDKKRQQSEEGQWNKKTKEAAKDVSKLNIAMVAGLAIATERSPDAAIRRLATRAANVHMRIGLALEELASEQNIELPETLTDEQRQEIEALKEVPRQSFNQAFLEGAQMAQKRFRKYAGEFKNQSDPELKALGKLMGRVAENQQQILEKLDEAMSASEQQTKKNKAAETKAKKAEAEQDKDQKDAKANKQQERKKALKQAEAKKKTKADQQRSKDNDQNADDTDESY